MCIAFQSTDATSINTRIWARISAKNTITAALWIRYCQWPNNTNRDRGRYPDTAGFPVVRNEEHCGGKGASDPTVTDSAGVKRTTEETRIVNIPSWLIGSRSASIQVRENLVRGEFRKITLFQSGYLQQAWKNVDEINGIRTYV
jgi:hypothetical protein